MAMFEGSSKRLRDRDVQENSIMTGADITRDQWQHFLDTYRPVEDEALQSAMQTDFSKEGDEAGNLARAASTASRGTLSRNLSRSGSQLTAEERTAVQRRQTLSLTKAASRAENTTRRGLSDSRTQMLADAVSLGRGVATTASGGAHSADDMANARQMQHEQQRASATSTNLSTAASAAALLIAFV